MESLKPICPGCGAPMQSHSASSPGYRQKPDHPLCQRCFRLKHYGDTSRFDQSDVSLAHVLREIRAIEGTIIVLIDLVNFDPNMLDVLETHLFDRPIVLVFTKRDLLPRTLSHHKIRLMIKRHLKNRRLRVLDALMVSTVDQASITALSEFIDSLEGDVLITGLVNAGKSSLINALLGYDRLTVSPHAHTTLAVQALPFHGKLIYDTPGFHGVNALEGLSVQQAAGYAISTPIKPITYQINQEQTLVLGEVAAVKLIPRGNASVTVYAAPSCTVHRSGVRAKAFLTAHHPNLALCEPVMMASQLSEASDLVIAGLGWISLKGSFESLQVHLQHPECCSLRKALL